MQKNKKQKNKLNNKNKDLIKNGIFGFVAIFFLAIIIYASSVTEKTKEAAADSVDNIGGWAWSDNIGWISFNSTNCDADGNGVTDTGNFSGCPVGIPITSYGVDMDNATGDINDDSFAWNSNVGWLNFNPLRSVAVGGLGLGMGDLPVVLTGDDYQFDAKKIGSEIVGWAKFTTFTDDADAGNDDRGWVRLSPDPNDNNSAGWGVSASLCTGGKVVLNGYGWSDDFGWISFNGVATNAEADPYNVYIALAPSAPVLDVLPPISSECDETFISWNNVEGETGYLVEHSIDNIVWNSACNVGADIVSCIDTSLFPGILYYYRVKALGCANSGWSFVGTITTNSVCGFPSGWVGGCGINQVCVSGQCPNKVNVSWGVPLSGGGANLRYTVQRKVVKDSEGNPVIDNFVDAIGVCKDIAATSCTDVVGAGNKTYVYKVIAVNINNTDQNESNISSEVKPCIPLPSWEEINPR